MRFAYSEQSVSLDKRTSVILKGSNTMKMFNKIAAAMFSVVTAASMGIVISVSATDYSDPRDQNGNLYSPNTKDTSWNAGDSVHDYCRRKFTDSSVYVCNYSMTHAANVDVYGRVGKYDSDVPVSINGHKTYNVYLPANRAGEIYQGIYEHNPRCLYAHINFKDADTAYGAAYGVWSPDCAGSYSPLN